MQEGKKVEELTPEEIQAIIDERDSAKSNVNSTVEELKTLRKAKQDAEQAKKELEEKLSKTTPESDVAKIVSEQLASRSAEMIKDIEIAAWKDFIKENPEFSEDVDKTGIRNEAFKKELSRFNMTGAKSKEDFSAVYNDAITLLYRKENKEYISPYASNSSTGGGGVRTSDDSNLSQKEKDTMKRLGWDLKKFTDIKLKHPELYGSLFN